MANRLLAHLVPHRALVGSRLDAGADGLAHLARLRAAELGVGGLRGAVEVLAVAAAVPAARSTQLTGMRVFAAAPTSTVTSSVRFCWAPSSSSPSNMRSGSGVGLWTTRSRTEAPPSSSVTVAPWLRPSANEAYSKPRLGPEDGEDGERAGDVGVAEAELAVDQVGEGGSVGWGAGLKSSWEEGRRRRLGS